MPKDNTGAGEAPSTNQLSHMAAAMHQSRTNTEGSPTIAPDRKTQNCLAGQLLHSDILEVATGGAGKAEVGDASHRCCLSIIHHHIMAVCA